MFFDDELKHEDYKNIFFNRSYMRYEVNSIQSKDRNIGLSRISKISLISYDNEKYILKDGCSRFSYFYKPAC